MRRDVLDIGGVATPVLSDGAADDAQAVVCLHGNPGHSGDWLDLMPRVATFSRVVAPDMPGFGAAGKPEGFDYSPAGYTRHLTALLARLGVERAHLILHDFGVAWGLGWATLNPGRVASLTLVNIGALPGYRWHALARLWRTPALGEASMALATRWGLHALLKIGNPRGLPRAFIDGMYDYYDAGTRRAVLRLYRATPQLDVDAQTLRGLGAPVSVIWGAADPYVSASYAERQRDVFPQAEVTIFPDSGHWPHADNPERFAEVVIPFLRRAREA